MPPPTSTSLTIPTKPNDPTIGITLGGGGARGLAHIVALEALEELGLVPSTIAGTSIGAVFGAASAARLTTREMRAHVEEILSERLSLVRQLLSVRPKPIDHLLSIFPMRTALLDAEALLEALLPSRLPAAMDALSIPLHIVATDFYAQERVVITSGPLRRAIAASIALPVIFQSVSLEGRSLLDGGLVDPLPFDLVRSSVDISIAVDVSGAARKPTDEHGPRAWEALVSSSQILQRSIVKARLLSDRPDILIETGSEGVGVLDFHRYKEIVDAAAPARESLKRQLGDAIERWHRRASPPL
jgi:NTE family protein